MGYFWIMLIITGNILYTVNSEYSQISSSEMENNLFDIVSDNLQPKMTIITRNDWDKDLYETGETNNSTVDERSLVLLNKKIRTKTMFGQMKLPFPYTKLILKNHLINMNNMLLEEETKKYSNDLIDKQIFNEEYSTKLYKVQKDRIYYNIKEKHNYSVNKTYPRIYGYNPEMKKLPQKPIETNKTSECKNSVKVHKQ